MEIFLLFYFGLILAILIHETGHLLAVIFTKYKLIEFAVGPVSIKKSETKYIISLRRSLFTGIVVYKRPHGIATWGSEILIISAGVIANIVIGGVLIIYYHFISSNGLIAITGWVSISLGILNLFPTTIKEMGIDSDAKRLFSILTFKKNISQSKRYDLNAPAIQVKLQTLCSTTQGKAQIQLLNDNATPMDFVVDIIKTYFKFNDFSAAILMLAIHNEGEERLGWIDQDVALSLCEQINSEARVRGFPFQCRVLT